MAFKPDPFSTPHRYDPATGGLQDNVQTKDQIKILEVFHDCGPEGPIDSVMAAWSFDEYGAEYQQLMDALSRSKNGLIPALDNPDVIDAYANYMKAAMGGEYDDYISVWQWQMHQELLKKKGSPTTKGIPLGH